MLNIKVEKFKFMIFFKHPKKEKNFNIAINNRTNEQLDYFNLLGVTSDQNINYNPHTDYVNYNIFSKLILITGYYSFIHCHLTYKKAIRILADCPYISLTTPI